MTRISKNHAKHFLENFSFGNLSVSSDEYLKNATAWGIGSKGPTIIAAIVQRIQKKVPGDVRLDNIPLNDQSVYQLLQAGDTNGVVNLESEGIRALLRTMQPDCFEDLEALCAVYQPRPFSDGDADLLVARKRGAEPITFSHPHLKQILKWTYGVIFFRDIPGT